MFKWKCIGRQKKVLCHLKDLIPHDNLKHLTIQNASLTEYTQIKSGLKLSYYYLLKKLAIVVKIGYLLDVKG